MKIRPRGDGHVRMTVSLDPLVDSRKASRGIRSAPYRHGELPGGTKHAPRLCNSARLIGNMANPQVRHDNIKLGVGERKLLRVRFHERGVWRAPPCKRQHRRRKIDTDDLAATAQQRLGNIALSAAEIECLDAGSGTDRIQQAVDGLIGRGCEQFHIAGSARGIGPAAALHAAKCRKIAHRLTMFLTRSGHCASYSMTSSASEVIDLTQV